MIERTDPQYQQALAVAQEHARGLAQPHVGVDHLLLALLQPPVTPSVQQVLASVGITPEALHANVVQELQTGPGSPEGGLAPDAETREALDLSLAEAAAVGHDWLGTGHLLVAALKVRDPRVDLSRFRPALVGTVRSEDPPGVDQDVFRRPSEASVESLEPAPQPTGRRVFDTTSPDVRAYPLLTALVVPRAIAWVSTVDAEGRGNLAPHSFFTVASGKPPVVLFSSLGRKDTVRNIEATREFVVNFTSEALLDQVNDSSAPFEHGDDEASMLGIATAPSQTVAPPRVADSPASIECRLDRIVEVGTAYVVFGAVTAITVDEAVLDGDHPVFERLRPVSRLGRDQWGRPPETFDLVRPKSTDDVL